MNPGLIIFFCAALLFRLGTLAVSLRHERILKQNGAVEFGAANSTFLALAHLGFYFAALIEGIIRSTSFDATSMAGLALYGIGALSLLAVMRLLGRFWTVKLLIARDHTLVDHPLFRWFRHPNYFFSILPELVGIALAFHAFITLIAGIPIYAIPLLTRIRQEESVMRERFESY